MHLKHFLEIVLQDSYSFTSYISLPHTYKFTLGLVLNVLSFELFADTLGSLRVNFYQATCLIMKQKRHASIPFKASWHLTALYTAVSSTRCRVDWKVFVEWAHCSLSRMMIFTQSRRLLRLHNWIIARQRLHHLFRITMDLNIWDLLRVIRRMIILFSHHFIRWDLFESRIDIHWAFFL